MKTSQIAGTIVGLAIAAFLIWYFSSIVTYFLIAMVLTMIGSPLVRFFDRLHWKRFKIPRTIGVVMTMFLIVFFFALFISIFIPLVTKQAALISRIDTEMLSENLRALLISLEVFLHNTALLKSDKTLISFINENLENLLNLDKVSLILNNVVAFTGSLFVGVFSIAFITFFLLKEQNLVSKFVLLLVPERHHNETNAVFSESRHLLSRYFIGICIEVISMITILSTILSIFGIKNALLIGFIGGFLNIIPYLGPVIGASIGIVLGVTTVLSGGLYEEIIPVILIIAGTFLGANLIDNILLQPFIYSSSVKAHPLEIFIVLLMGGSLAGIIGMVLAIPAYTVIRVIASQFLNRFRIVQKLTERMRE